MKCLRGTLVKAKGGSRGSRKSGDGGAGASPWLVGVSVTLYQLAQSGGDATPGETSWSGSIVAAHLIKEPKNEGQREEGGAGTGRERRKTPPLPSPGNGQRKGSPGGSPFPGHTEGSVEGNQ